MISGASVFSCAFVTDLKLYFLTYGVLYGIGQALLLAATLAILPHYFDKRLSLANGLMSGLSSIVIVVLPIITGILLRRYGLRETFYVLGALNFMTIIMALSYRPMLPPSDSSLSIVSRLKESFGLEIFRKRNFIIWMVSGFIGIYGYMIPIVYIVSAINHTGLLNLHKAFMVSLFLRITFPSSDFQITAQRS